MRADTSCAFKSPLSGARWQRHHRRVNEHMATVAAVDAALAVVGQHFGLKPDVIRGDNLSPADIQKQPRIVQARSIAIYLASTAYDRGCSALSRVLPVTPQMVFYALRRIEDARDCPEFDALLERLADQLTHSPDSMEMAA